VNYREKNKMSRIWIL